MVDGTETMVCPVAWTSTNCYYYPAKQANTEASRRVTAWLPNLASPGSVGCVRLAGYSVVGRYLMLFEHSIRVGPIRPRYFPGPGASHSKAHTALDLYMIPNQA